MLRLSAVSAAIPAMFGPSGLEFLSYGSTADLVTGSIFNGEDRCWSFFSLELARAPRQEIIILRRISFVTLRGMNDGGQDGPI